MQEPDTTSNEPNDIKLESKSDLELSNKDLKVIMEWFELIEESAPDNLIDQDHYVGKKINDYLINSGFKNILSHSINPVTNLYMVKTSKKSVAVDDKYLVIVENKASTTYIAFAGYFVFIGILLSIHVSDFLTESTFNIYLITSFILFFIYIIFINLKRDIQTIELKNIKEIDFKNPDDKNNGYINFILDKQSNQEKNKIYFKNNKLREFQVLKTSVEQNKLVILD